MATIVDVGRVLQNYGLRVVEHPGFGGVSKGAHAENSYHDYGEAADVQDWRPDVAPEYEGGTPRHWKERTKNLAARAKQLGIFNEAFGPQDNNGHDSHVHLALKGKADRLRPEHKEWLATSRWKRPDGSYTYDMPGFDDPQPAAARGQSATGGVQLRDLSQAQGAGTQGAETQAATPPPPPDWRQAASDSGRSTNPNEAAYWQREDMRQWAAANPKLAAPLLASAGVSADSIKSTASGQTAGGQAAGPSQPETGSFASFDNGPDFKPVDRGVLNGTQVMPAQHFSPEAAKGAAIDFLQAHRAGLALEANGGKTTAQPAAASQANPAAATPSLQPYAFEIHADAAAESGGKTGFIGSYLDKENPLFDSLEGAYGNYGSRYSRQWRGGQLGGPRNGLSLIETRTAGSGMADLGQQKAEAQRLYDIFTNDPEVKSGARPVHFFAGHQDATNPGEQGAAGGDAAEKVWNRGVKQQLRALTQASGRNNFHFHEAIVANDASDPNTNWNRAKAIREEWLKRNRGGGQ